MVALHNASLTRRAQVNLFLILAVVFIGVIVLTALWTKKSEIPPPTQTPSSLKLQTEAFEGANYCLKEVSEAVIRIVALQGGYWKVGRPFAEGIHFVTPFYLQEGRVTIPSISVVEESIAKGVDELLPSCIQEQSHGVLGGSGLPASKAAITKKGVSIQTTYPLSTHDAKGAVVKDLFAVSHELPLFEALVTAQEMTALQQRAGSMVSVSDIAFLIAGKGGVFFPLHIDKTHYVYGFSLKRDSIEFPFAFAVSLQKDADEGG